MIQAYDPPGVWPPFGAFSMAVVQGEGRIVHLKGQVSLDETGAVVGAGDMRAQVRRTLQNLQAMVASFGGTLADVVSLVHYATDIEAFMTAGDIRQAFFRPPYPVTTTVEVARLYRPELMIEIQAVAEIPRDRFRAPPSA